MGGRRLGRPHTEIVPIPLGYATNGEYAKNLVIVETLINMDQKYNAGWEIHFLVPSAPLQAPQRVFRGSLLLALARCGIIGWIINIQSKKKRFLQ